VKLVPAKPLDEILEDEWDRDLFRGPNALAVMLGWTSYHVLHSKGSRGGYPDRTLVRDRIIFVELKRELTGRASEDRNRQPTADQVAWLDKLAAAGGEVYLWRPSDLDEISKVLTSRGPFDALSGSLKSMGGWWQPRSLWIPGVGRADALSAADDPKAATR
jgi:hypothetical protein